MAFLTRINDVLSALFCVFFAYQIVYLLIALFRQGKPLPPAAPIGFPGAGRSPLSVIPAAASRCRKNLYKRLFTRPYC